MIGDPAESYAVEVERRRRWRWEATVLLLAPGRGGARPLVTLRAVTRASARRRAARFISLRQRI